MVCTAAQQGFFLQQCVGERKEVIIDQLTGVLAQRFAAQRFKAICDGTDGTLEVFMEFERSGRRWLRILQQDVFAGSQAIRDVLHEAPAEEDAKRRHRQRGIDFDGIDLTVLQNEVAAWGDRKAAVGSVPNRFTSRHRLDGKGTGKIRHPVTGAGARKDGIYFAKQRSPRIDLREHSIYFVESGDGELRGASSE